MTRSIIDEEILNAEIPKSINFWSCIDVKRQSKPITMKMIKLDWMYRPRKCKGNTGLGGLLELLANAPESIMHTVLVRSLVENFYDENKQRVVIYCYIPFIISLVYLF